MNMDISDLNLELYLIRHATPTRKIDHWSSSTTPLNKFGLRQAEKVGEFLANQNFSAIMTSPYKRATQTAKSIAKYHKSVFLQEEPWLAEIDLGEWAGRHKDDIKSQLPVSLKRLLSEGYDERGPLVANLLMNAREFQFPKGESPQEFWKRVVKGFSQILDQFKGKENQKLCLIGHGGSFTVIVLSLLGKSFSDQDLPLFLFDKANYTVIRIKKERVYFLCMNPIL